MKHSELYPAHPERICWGCEQRCSDTDLGCGNGTIRTPHPIELFGEDWDVPATTPVREAKTGD